MRDGEQNSALSHSGLVQHEMPFGSREGAGRGPLPGENLAETAKLWPGLYKFLFVDEKCLRRTSKMKSRSY